MITNPHENLTLQTIRIVVMRMVPNMTGILHFLLVQKSIRIMGTDIPQKLDGLYPYPSIISCILVLYYQELLHTPNISSTKLLHTHFQALVLFLQKGYALTKAVNANFIAGCRQVLEKLDTCCEIACLKRYFVKMPPLFCTL